MSLLVLMLVACRGGEAGGPDRARPLGDALEGACPGDEPPAPGSGVGEGKDLHRVTLRGHPRAVCNDGSPAILFVRRAATPEAAGDWVVHQQAGGSCGSWRDCRDRWCGYETSYDASKMSSRFAPLVSRAQGLFLRSERNPFGDANQVYLYYCSSDAWIGRAGDRVLDDPAGDGPSYRIHFRGADILDAAVDALSAGVTSDDGVVVLPPLGEAATVLVSGSSAGSVGLTHALDWWAEQLPGTRVEGLFDSGTDPVPDDIDDPAIAYLFEGSVRPLVEEVFLGLYDGRADESCLAAHADDPFWCAVPSHVRLNHLTTPFFARQDLSDPVQHGVFSVTGESVGDMADALELTMARFADVPELAEEADAIAVRPGVHASNCRQHIVLMTDEWFGVAEEDNHTVRGPVGTPRTLVESIAAWRDGTEILVLDENPSVGSYCPKDDEE